jgi:hypothetical protein
LAHLCKGPDRKLRIKIFRFPGKTRLQKKILEARTFSGRFTNLRFSLLGSSSCCPEKPVAFLQQQKSRQDVENKRNEHEHAREQVGGAGGVVVRLWSRVILPGLLSKFFGINFLSPAQINLP